MVYSDITIIKILGTYFLILIGIMFFMIVRRIMDLEKYAENIEKKIR